MPIITRNKEEYTIKVKQMKAELPFPLNKEKTLYVMKHAPKEGHFLRFYKMTHEFELDSKQVEIKIKKEEV